MFDWFTQSTLWFVTKPKIVAFLITHKFYLFFIFEVNFPPLGGGARASPWNNAELRLVATIGTVREGYFQSLCKNL